MARKFVEQFVDDLDGSVAAETVFFDLDGISYEIDLSATNAGALRNLFAGYIAGALKRSPPPSAERGPRPDRRWRPRSFEDLKAIRAWAQECGLPISDHGGIPTKIMEQYSSAGD